MHTIIISDLHLTRRFEKRKFNFLKKIIERSDQVVINGDLWDYYFSSFSQFVRSPWRQLFPLLKEKKTVYLYGNHDR
ncbi:metallophosphoesterase, partial [Candidatus Gottesmanbacteria bacterium]|nr:metallophosphoesterase [Candidatus Gottesmanbacteria bacterium]